MPGTIGVNDFDADGFAQVARLYGVGFAGRARNDTAIGKPLVFDAARGNTVRVVDVGGEGLADFGVTSDLREAGGVCAVVIGDGDGRLVADLSRLVAHGVLHRGRVAGEVRLRGEGDFAELDVPFALPGDGDSGDGVARRINQTDAVRVEVALAVGIDTAVVVEDVNGDFFFRDAFDFVVFCTGFRVAAGLVRRRRLRIRRRRRRRCRRVRAGVRRRVVRIARVLVARIVRIR